MTFVKKSDAISASRIVSKSRYFEGGGGSIDVQQNSRSSKWSLGLTGIILGASEGDLSSQLPLAKRPVFTKSKYSLIGLSYSLDYEQAITHA